MGIKGLTQLLEKKADRGLKEQSLEFFAGKTIAIDASVFIYQFLKLSTVGDASKSPLMGIFYRTLRLLKEDITPIYVFDGEAPLRKGSELAKRAATREENTIASRKAHESGDVAAAEKIKHSTAFLTKEVAAEYAHMLRLMGVIVLEAPGEAEAQCAELCKAGLAYATATEDMEALAFGTPRLVRQFWARETGGVARKAQQRREFTLSILIETLDLTMAQFVDMCILCGCDYTSGIRGVGEMKAYKLIQKHGDLSAVVAAMKRGSKNGVPDDFDVEELRRMFHAPHIIPSNEVELTHRKPDYDALTSFLLGQGLEHDTVTTGVQRLRIDTEQSSQSGSASPMETEDSRGKKRRAGTFVNGESDRAGAGPSVGSKAVKKN